MNERDRDYYERNIKKHQFEEEDSEDDQSEEAD